MILKLRIYKYTYINDIKKKKKNKIVYLQGNIKDIFKTTIII